METSAASLSGVLSSRCQSGLLIDFTAEDLADIAQTRALEQQMQFQTSMARLGMSYTVDFSKDEASCDHCKDTIACWSAQSCTAHNWIQHAKSKRCLAAVSQTHLGGQSGVQLHLVVLRFLSFGAASRWQSVRSHHRMRPLHEPEQDAFTHALKLFNAQPIARSQPTCPRV